MHTFDNFGSHLFSKSEMKRKLPRPVYLKWKTAVYKETSIDQPTADAIAHAMKEWAIEKGATHYSHWFLPLNGNTAQKHDSFVYREDGKLLVRFSGKSLIKGETDGSSFPSGGLRATFEARGYTYWDITSYAFIRGRILYIPSIFVSYRGDKLDMKAPLLEAMDVLSDESVKLLDLLGDKDVKSVKPMIGLEQEYFLIKTKFYNKRPDLIYTGRTLIGAKAPKEQEFHDHYFGKIPEDIDEFMNEVNSELWKLGIFAKVEHNEAAPSQYEIAVIYDKASIAIDQNMIVMDVLKSTANKHGLTCLLHEKPFYGVNGSGKHNNISFETETGMNMLDPGDTPSENVRFLLFISAFVSVMDKYPLLFRMVSSDAGNDHRLGASEAPPAIISVYLGEKLTEIVDSIIDSNISSGSDEEYMKMYSPLKNIARMPHDNTDRNRTSPVAFTGKKFEMRMLGASKSAAMLNISIYAAIAEAISEINDELKALKPDMRQEGAYEIAKRLLKKHRRVIYSGDGYSSEWIKEAEKRGLANVPSFNESIDVLLDKKVIDMFEKFGILSEAELRARRDILHETFNDVIKTEVLTLESIVNRQIIPALMKYIREIMRTDFALDAKSKYLNKQKKYLAELLDELSDKCDAMMMSLEKSLQESDIKKIGERLNKETRVKLNEVRKLCDDVEKNIAIMHYPLPTYSDMLYIKE
ncbi:MAG: glutamine synthetase type III [Clostridiales bacterium]|nr:MAG: glutamine synthetase type III [Clostridiales bacterium]